MDWITTSVSFAFRRHGFWCPDSRDDYKSEQLAGNCAKRLSILQPAWKRSWLGETPSNFRWAIPILDIAFLRLEDPRFLSWISGDQYQLNQEGIHSIWSQRDSYWKNCKASNGSFRWTISIRNWYQWSLWNVSRSYCWSLKLD